MTDRNIAVVFAGGTGVRMRHDEVPKQFMVLKGKPVIIYTLELFELHPMVTDIVVVCLESWIEHLRGLLAEFSITKVRSIVAGGESTQASIFEGLCEAERLVVSDGAVVLIHDGVRPLIEERTITDNILMVHEKGSCITCALPTETIIVEEERGMNVPKRSRMLVGRAPQSFFLRDILAVHRQAVADGKHDFIDCCEMMHSYGMELATVIGPSENIKITTPQDFYVFEAMLKMREEKR